MLRPTTHFYSRPPRGGRLTFLIFLAHLVLISIHALREEGDLLSWVCSPVMVISIHALREEGDVSSWAKDAVDFVFLSTPSARRATEVLRHSNAVGHDFYPRPPRGGRPLRHR